MAFRCVQTSEQAPKEAPLTTTRWKLWGRGGKPPLCQRSNDDDFDDFSWASLEQLGGPHGSKACGLGVAKYTASRPNWYRIARLCWRKAKTGRRRARLVGSGGTRSSVPFVAEKKACCVFLENRGRSARSIRGARFEWKDYFYVFSAIGERPTFCLGAQKHAGWSWLTTNPEARRH
eukprot:3905-Amphidinium_carterae.1